MNTMNKGVNSFFVSFIAIILASPIAGVTSTFVHSDSQFLSDDLSDSKKLKALKYTAFSLVGLTTIFLLFKNSLFDFVGLRDGQYQNFYGIDFVKALRKDRRNLFTADVLRTLFFVSAVATCLWFYLRQNITKNIAFVLLGLLIVIDLAGVDWRYVNNDNFVSAHKVNKPYTATSIDEEILKDTTVFRVYDASDASTRSSYFHNAIGGYHAAKMRRFNEVMDFHIDKGNPEVFNMLNTKYIIYNNDDNQLQYLENDEVNGHHAKSIEEQYERYKEDALPCIQHVSKLIQRLRPAWHQIFSL